MSTHPDWNARALAIKRWAKEIGFAQAAISDIDLARDEQHLLNWLNAGLHGSMHYMQQHGTKRSRPADLVPGTIRVLSVRMDYWPEGTADAFNILHDPEKAFISRYALGRDYHKIMRKMLQKLASKIETEFGQFGYRAFVDSAPVLEKALAQKAGLGWIGKHSNLLSREAGSWFFLGELYLDLPLPPDSPGQAHCGTCQKCIDDCPTAAIIAPYIVDARRCISYLTIELHGSIPLEFRKAIGNRIYGCDDCQLVCPWNRFSTDASDPFSRPKHQLDAANLLDLFAWTEQEFLDRTEGSPIRRIGYERWLRNIAVALGNTSSTKGVITALQNRAETCTEIVKEHIVWALNQHKPPA